VRRSHGLAAATAVIATPIAAWWLIGDQSERIRGRGTLDYVVRAPDVPKWLVAAAGATALLATLVSICALVVGIQKRQLDRRWLGIVVLLMSAGFIAAGIGRTITAGVHGANIGAGLALVFGVPLCAFLVGFGAYESRDSVRRRAAQPIGSPRAREIGHSVRSGRFRARKSDGARTVE
jgi:hypothetical protein